MRKHNLDRVIKACGIVMEGRGKGRAKVVSKTNTIEAITKLCKALTARCSCCGRRLPVNHTQDKGHVCKARNCKCKTHTRKGGK